MNNTLEYYNTNADRFVTGTVSVDFVDTQTRFMDKFLLGACILDFSAIYIQDKQCRRIEVLIDRKYRSLLGHFMRKRAYLLQQHLF